jgi:hypothetical protein
VPLSRIDIYRALQKNEGPTVPQPKELPIISREKDERLAVDDGEDRQERQDRHHGPLPPGDAPSGASERVVGDGGGGRIGRGNHATTHFVLARLRARVDVNSLPSTTSPSLNYGFSLSECLLARDHFVPALVWRKDHHLKTAGTNASQAIAR